MQKNISRGEWAVEGPTQMVRAALSKLVMDTGLLDTFQMYYHLFGTTKVYTHVEDCIKEEYKLYS